MRGLLALQPEIRRGAHQSFAEGALPNAINQHARHQRMPARRKPLYEAKPIPRSVLGKLAHHGKHPRLQWLALWQVILTTFQQFCFTRLG